MLPGALLLGACATLKSVPATDAPAWLLSSPSEFFQKKCAIGRSSATLYREDARVHAGNSARVALAEAYEVRIRSKMVDVQTNSLSAGEGDSVVQVSEISSDTVLKNSDIVAHFFDAAGAFSGGEKNVTFAVACVR